MSDMQRLRHRPEILVMTSNGSAEVIEQARRIGARSIILKPFEHLDLIEGEVEKAVQALFEARATSSCKMMAPPSVKRNVAAPTATPPPAAAKPEATAPAKPEAAAAAKPEATAPAKPEAAAPAKPEAAAPAPEVAGPEIAAPSTGAHAAPSPAGEESFFLGNETPDAGPGAPDMTSAAAAAKPIEVARTPSIPADPPAAPDAGLTMRIDRADFAIAPSPPPAQPAPEPGRPDMPAVAVGGARKQPDIPAIASGGGTKPASAVTPPPSGESSGRDTRRSPAADKMRGRVGLPNLGALKTKLFGKGADLSGGHLARSGFSVPAPTGASPASPPATPVGSTETARPASDHRTATERPDGPSLVDPVPSEQPATDAEPVAPAPITAPAAEPVVPPMEIAHGAEPIALPVKAAPAAAPVATPVEITQGTKPIVPPVEIAQNADPILPAVETAEATAPVINPVESPPAPAAVEKTCDAGDADRQEGAGGPETSNGDPANRWSRPPGMPTAKKR
jgi:hypothetical protein